MIFKSIELYHFRNIEQQQLELHPKINIFLGDNAQGKTSFIEAISTLAQGHSFRTSDFSNLIKKQVDDGARIQAEVESKNLLSQLSLILAQGKKSWYLNNKKISQAKWPDEFSAILFSPESLSIIKDSDSSRRDFLDEIVLSVFKGEKEFLFEQRQLLRQRNRFLKDLSEQKETKTAENLNYLDTLTEHFLRHSARLCLLRVQSLQKIKPYLQEALSGIFDHSVDISVEYSISGENYAENSREFNLEIAYNAMYKRWQQLRSAEIETGFSLIGPHKHEIKLLWDGNDSRYYCSQGQQRLAILAFKMAQIRLHFLAHGIYPVLLLDDVLSEIDEKKRRRLIQQLEEVNAQIFITTTEKTVLETIRSPAVSLFSVKSGTFKNESILQTQFGWAQEGTQ